MTAPAVRQPTAVQILAARVSMKADRMLGDTTPEDIRAIAELPLPNEPESSR